MLGIWAGVLLACLLPLAGQTPDCPPAPASAGAENWFARLANPVLRSDPEIDARVRENRHLLACFANYEAGGPLSPQLQTLKRLTEYFIIFAAQPRELVDLGTSRDPAVLKLRDQVRLPPPPGFIYIRHFDDKSEMPEAIRPGFDNPETQAVTLWGRYIAVLRPASATPAERQVAARTIPKVLSHELVHAYINSGLRLSDYDKLPPWFQEGCAVYFSGSGGTESAVEINGATWNIYTVKDTREYREYGLMFRELERRTGRRQLYAGVREAVERRDPGVLLRAAGVSTADEIVFAAKERDATTQKVATYMVSFILIALCYWIYRSFRPPAPALPAAPLALVQAFQRLANRIDKYVPEPKSEELAAAQTLLDRHAAEDAYYIVHYAARKLRRHADEFGQSRIFMLPDALPYEAEALEQRNAAARPD
ncbi:MAG: hypothetical protein M3O35_00275 [Acidobacteriota bacterium]|nr:hypothetical protein [Acidobacteriota bacterium]